MRLRPQSGSNQRTSIARLQVVGSTIAGATKLQWKSVRRAQAYAIEWLDKDGKWATLWTLERDEIAPTDGGFIEYVDNCPGPMGPGGTYRVIAYFNLEYTGESVCSSPVVLTPNRPHRSTQADFLRRVERKTWPAVVKSLISRLKWSQHGWTTVLPKGAGQCLGKRIEVDVRVQELTDDVLELLADIVGKLPKLASRVEKAFNGYGGPVAIDEDDDIKRPRIVIDEAVRSGKPGSRWAMVIEMKSSDYGWHIEFVRSRFKEIWAGD